MKLLLVFMIFGSFQFSWAELSVEKKIEIENLWKNLTVKVENELNALNTRISLVVDETCLELKSHLIRSMQKFLPTCSTLLIEPLSEAMANHVKTNKITCNECTSKVERIQNHLNESLNERNRTVQSFLETTCDSQNQYSALKNILMNEIDSVVPALTSLDTIKTIVYSSYNSSSRTMLSATTTFNVSCENIYTYNNFIANLGMGTYEDHLRFDPNRYDYNQRAENYMNELCDKSNKFNSNDNYPGLLLTMCGLCDTIISGRCVRSVM